MRFRLRYLHHDLELSEGQFAIGRSSDCQLSLDDPLVSRRHAVLTVDGHHVLVEDQHSRNGVVVNGVRITAPTAVRPGDRIVIGSQELILMGPMVDRPGVANPGFGKQTLTRMPLLPQVSPEPGGTAQPGEGETDLDSTMVRRVQAFRLLGGVAEKALAMGRADEAERLMAVPLSELLDASRLGRRLGPSLVDTVCRLAAKLASATAKASWADYVVELYQAQGRPCPAPVIDELNNAVRKVSGIDLVRLRDYLAALHEKQATFGPAERFLLQRLEGLERLAALR